MKNIFNCIAPLYEKLHIGANKTFKKLRSLTTFEPTDVVLDIGGGTGRIAKFLVGKVKEITVIDPAEKMIRECQKHSGLTCIVGSAENIPVPDMSVDKILIVDAFHHFQNQEQAITQMHRVLRPGGKIIMEEFNPKTFGGKLITYIEKIEQFFGHKSIFYSPTNLADFFSKHGFKTQITESGKKEYYLVAEK